MTAGEAPLIQLLEVEGTKAHLMARNSRGSSNDIGIEYGGNLTELNIEKDERSSLDTTSRPQSAVDDDNAEFSAANRCSDGSYLRSANASKMHATFPHIPKEMGKAVARGRTLERGPRSVHPLAAAESRIRDNVAAIEVDVRPVKRRRQNRSRSSTLYKNPSETCAELEDYLLEPCPEAEVCKNFAEVLSSSDDVHDVLGLHSLFWSGGMLAIGARTLTSPRGNVDATYGLHFKSIASEDASVFVQPVIRFNPNLPPYYSQDECGFSTLQDQCEPPNKLSSAQRLPTEIIQQVYLSLAPADFNSSRHTCRSWFLSSLEHSMLEKIVKRGGWNSSLDYETAARNAFIGRGSGNLEWALSKFVSRECALGPDWTGNGLNEGRMETNTSSKTYSAFLPTSTIDFRDMGVHYPSGSTSGSGFTMSSCGKYLIVSNGCLIYVYELNTNPSNSGGHSVQEEPGALRPVTNIVCPYRVLACSMDTSSSRHAIAVLLDGRVGLVCDLTIGGSGSVSSDSLLQSQSSKSGKGSKHPLKYSDLEVDHFLGSACLDRVSFHSSASRATTNPSTENRFVFPGIFATSRHSSDEEAARQGAVGADASHRPAMPLDGTGFSTSDTPHAFEKVYGARSQLHKNKQVRDWVMPVEKGPRSLYRDLCSDDDPPRSVAICPQRRCVAFGCASGIELHWVDALTGQDLNRWFPLTAPSDFLFFLPPRPAVDSHKKLRLISSAARPSERAAIVDRASVAESMASPFRQRMDCGEDHDKGEGSSNFNHNSSGLARTYTRARIFSSRADSSDHYRAVPLSDGYHVLFIDPPTGLLCLGSDAPAGGPTKLLRKIWFQGPDSAASPICYIGGTDLTRGVRVVAAFDTGAEQSIWFFSVPSDVFEANYCHLVSSRSAFLQRSDTANESHNTAWMHWWPDDGLQEWLTRGTNIAAGTLPRSVWPVKIRGQQIGTCRSVVDLAIDAGPQMTIWAFSADGVAKAWTFDEGRDESSAKHWVVARDGTVRRRDENGDIEMLDLNSASASSSEDNGLPTSSFQSGSFDGSTSLYPSTVFTTRSTRFQLDDWTRDSSRQRYVQQHLNDDVIMSDEEGFVVRDVDEVESRTGRVTHRSLLMDTVRFSRRSFRDYRFAEDEATGIARLDIEIR